MTQHEPRVPLSTVPCLACRLRRKKCDRTLPCCDRCSGHEIGYLCVYKDPVGLFLKSSSATVLKEKQMGEEMRREMRYNRCLLEYLRMNLLVGDRMTRTADSRGNRGFQRSISSSTTLPTEQSSDALEIVISVLNNERLKNTRQRYVELSLQTGALQQFDEMCIAEFVGLCSGDSTTNAFTSLLQEIATFLPDEATLKKLYETARKVNQPRFVMGPPRLPETFFTSMESLISYKNSLPVIALSLPQDKDNLPFLILLLITIAKAHSLLSATFVDLGSLASVKPILYLRYATALLKISTEDQYHSLPLLLAMVKLHLDTQYNSSASSFSFSIIHTQQRALTTKRLVSRAKAFHWNQDLRPFYPSLSKDERRMYNDTWTLLVFMDLLDSLELGHQPSIQLSDFRSCAESEMKSLPALRVCHEVLSTINFLKGEVSAEVMIQVLLDSIAKIKRAFGLLGTTFKEDHVSALDFSEWKGRVTPSVISGYHLLLERRLMRLFMFSIIQTLYCMASRCFEELQQTAENIAKARVIEILAHKYSFVALSFQVTNALYACSKGADLANHHSFVFVQGLLHDSMAFEMPGSGRSLVWLLSKLQILTGLTTQELSDQLLYQRDDEEMLKSVIDKLSKRPELARLPLDFDFDDFASDEDPGTLVELERLVDPRNMVFICVSNILRFCDYISKSKFMDFSMIKISTTFMLGIRYSFVGVRMFFPDEVKEYQDLLRASVQPAQNINSTLVTVDPLANDTFVGTFRDLFEEGIETSKEFDLGHFFGSNYDANLEETWTSGLFEYPLC